MSGNVSASHGVPAWPALPRQFGGYIPSQTQLPINDAGDFFVVDGTAAIASLPAAPAGMIVDCLFTGAATLTHSASALICPGGGNVQLAASDIVRFYSLGDGLWRAAILRGNLYLPSASKIDFAAGDITITHSSNTLTLAGATNYSFDSLITAGGGQIAFPASQNASADANTLDDYEEGSFTPAITLGGAAVGVTYATQAGFYTKIGNRVFFELHIALTSKGSSAGALLITGLPFTPAGSNFPVSIYPSVVTSGVGDTSLHGRVNASATNITLAKMSSGAASALQDTDIVNTFNVQISGQYRI